MTKKQMIQSIQLQDATAFLKFKQAQLEWGTESNITTTLRCKFVAIDNLMESLGIVRDFNLPDHRAALDMILVE